MYDKDTPKKHSGPEKYRGAVWERVKRIKEPAKGEKLKKQDHKACPKLFWCSDAPLLLFCRRFTLVPPPFSRSSPAELRRSKFQVRSHDPHQRRLLTVARCSFWANVAHAALACRRGAHRWGPRKR